MPYGYSASALRVGAPVDAGAAPSPPGGRRRGRSLAVAVAAACVAGTLAGVLVALTDGGGSAATPAATAVRRALVAANVLEQNLGAPAPGPTRTATARSFALASHPITAHGVAGGLPPAVATPLSAAAGRTVLLGQRAALRAVFSGPLLRREEATLAALVADEEAHAGARAAPGGAAVVRWYSVRVDRTTARAEALVARWEQQDHLRARAGRLSYATSVVREEVDALATLERSGGKWRLLTLAAAPWQEPT